MLNVNLHPFPALSTQRLNLRAVTVNDSLAIYHMRNDTEVMKYLVRPADASVAHSEEWVKMINGEWENNNMIIWAITIKGHDILIGNIGYRKIIKEHHRAEVGYTLATANKGKGYMNEALRAVIRYGFNNLKLHTIEANVNPDNQPSINLLEKNGFVREGYYKEHYCYDGKFIDTATYSLLTPNS